MTADWQGPGMQRARLGADAFSADRYPLILSETARNQGAAGLAQWDLYLKKYPRDGRGRTMRLATLALSDPARAQGELQKLAQSFPGNTLYRELRADCLWRMKQAPQSLAEFAALSQIPEFAKWRMGPNGHYKALVLAGATPPDTNTQLLDRIRQAGDWKLWLANMGALRGDAAQLQARIQAAGHAVTLQRQVTVLQAAVGRINGAIARENAQIEAAKALAAKQDAEAAVRAKAQAAVSRSQARVKELQAALAHAQPRATAAEARLKAFRAAVGLGAEAPPISLAASYAAPRLQKGTLSPATVFYLAQRLWGQEGVEPFLENVVARNLDAGAAQWAVDRLVELAVQGEAPGKALDLLAGVGIRDPRDARHAGWLKRACDMALEQGNVYAFARNAHVLAALHADNKDLAGYLSRLGEVFEKAGNYVSAEMEYRRVIESTKEPAQRRRAQLALAGLYRRRGRPLDALQILSRLVRIGVPQVRDGKALPPTAPKMPEKPAAEDAKALVLAAQCYLDLEFAEHALNAYGRAAAQTTFGTEVRPGYDALSALARASLDLAPARTFAESDDEDKHTALPPQILERAQTALAIVDTVFQLHQKTLTPPQVVHSTLLRADANILMRNYPRAIEEIRAAKVAAKDDSVGLFADLKMGEVHLATDNADQAMSIFRKLAAMDRGDVSPIALFWMGTTQLRVNDKDKAIESFRVLWERYAENDLVRQAIYTIARTYAEQGAFLDAIRLYEAVGAMNSLPREKVVPGDALTVKVWDADHYLGTGQYTLPVKIRASSGDTENLLLEMNKINHSLFLGTIRTELGDPNIGDDLLQVVGTDMVYVTYQDRFKGIEKGQEISAEAVKGERRTSLIQVTEDTELTVSPTVFVEGAEEEEDIYVRKTEEEIEEERRLAALSSKLERGQGVVRPGNLVYLRVQDADFDVSPEPDTVTVDAFTYAPLQGVPAGQKTRVLAEVHKQPHAVEIVSLPPDNPSFQQEAFVSPAPEGRPRLDAVRITLVETGPHTGVFYGSAQTNVNGPTAIASDQSGEHVAALAIDNSNKASDAWMGFIDGKPDKWLEIDMKQVRTVQKITWDRGEGADDRYLIDYTVTLSGEGAPVTIERKDNETPHGNEIVLEQPVRCRWVRITAQKFEGDAPAISLVQVIDPDGTVLIPPEIPPLERARNDVLEFNVGDCMAAEIVDEENITPGRSVKRVSNPLGIAYVDGIIDAVFLSYGDNKVRGSLLLREDKERKREALYGRRTKQVGPEEVLQILISDPDLDVDEGLNTVICRAESTSGDAAELKARELDVTAAVFKARIQLSASETAIEDTTRLYVRPGDMIVLRYLDEHNRKPGHAVHRQAVVYIADDRVANYPGTEVAIASPQAAEDSLFPPNLEFHVQDTDLAVPGTDRVPLQLLSFATGDLASVNLMLQDLDGTFSSRVPLRMGDKPHVELPPDADPKAPRRLVSLGEAGSYRARSGGRSSALSDFLQPLAFVGDDILWMKYVDPAPKAAQGRVFVPIAKPGLLADLAELGVALDALPENATAAGFEIALADPYLELTAHAKTRQEGVLKDIARKKRHYKRLLATYQEALETVGKRIDGLLAGRAPSAAPASDEPPPEIPPQDAPLSTEEAVGGPLGGEDLTASEELIRAAALRRDRDALAKAMTALQRRLQALERYKTEELEA